MASQTGFEPAAVRLGGESSIQLRYWDIFSFANQMAEDQPPLRRRLHSPAVLRGHDDVVIHDYIILTCLFIFFNLCFYMTSKKAFKSCFRYLL